MPRMCLHIYVSHFRNTKIQIDLCGGNIRMSKHFLHTLYVRSILQHMCGKRMSQCMRRDIMLDSGFLCISLQNFPESLSAHGFTGTVGKKTLRLIFFYKCSTGLLSDISPWLFLHTFPIGNDPFLLLIMTDHIAKLQIEILQIQVQAVH